MYNIVYRLGGLEKMIIDIRAKNCFAFPDEILFSMKADMRNKKFSTNVFKENNFNVLKVAGIYGPNNVGKTCLIKCLRSIRNVLSHRDVKLSPNIFSDNPICELEITFLYNGRKFDYSFKYDTEKKEYPYEKFIEIKKDNYGNEKEIVFLTRDTMNKQFLCQDKELENMLPVISKSNIIIYLLDTDSFEEVNEMKEILTSFANKIDIVDMNNIPIKRTIELMKNENELQRKVVNFIKNADLDLENIKYSDIDEIGLEVVVKEGEPEEKVLDIPEQLMNQIRLTSVYRGVSVPSLLFDSTGTKKITALASYIVEAIEDGKILIVDELDSSIHFKLTRAIVAMFNNELNTNAQLIFTVHDINLMDCQKLFRKEQIWFIHKDSERVYVYSLADFTAAQGVRDTSDVMEKYRKGVLGALPDPELINSLLSIKGNTKGELNGQ